jgi:hypothetical protein
MTEPTGPETPARRSEEPGLSADGDARHGRGLRRRQARGGDDLAPGAADTDLPGEGGWATGRGNPVAWTSLLVAVVLTVWQAVFALSVERVAAPDQDLYTSVSLFVTLILGLAAAVLGLVGISQRRRPRWPALAGLAVGLNAFLVAVFSWIGGLMNTGA